MTKKEQLDIYLNQYNDLKMKYDASHKDLIEFGKKFDEWIGSITKLAGKPGQVHLTEIIANWDKFSND